MEPAHAKVGELLRREYAIAPVTIADAPRGFVAETYDVTAADGRRFFAKLLPTWADAGAVIAGLPVLEELHARGIGTVSRPVRTAAGAFTTELDGLRFILFDWVEGRSGADVDYDLADYVALLTRIHQATPHIHAPVPREEFELPWAAQLERFFDHGLHVPPSTPTQADLRRLLEGYQAQMSADWSTLQALARACRQAGWRGVITHGDGGGSNVILGTDGRLYLIDWDVLVLGPPERDTWFHLNDNASAAAFLPLYRRAFPDYQPDPLFHRFYLWRRFFEDLLGYVVNIEESPSHDFQRWNLDELQTTCFEWLWPAMRRADAIS